MSETRKFVVPQQGVGEDPRAARSRLARQILLSLGATEADASQGADEASQDPHFLDDIVAGLVDDGVVSLARLPDRRATEAMLGQALGPAFCSALDRRRGLPAGTRERARLARLYSIAQEVEKAASCYREVLDEKGPLPLSFVLEGAEAAARAGERGIALGAVDRVAEVVLTGDAAKEGRLEDVALAGGALERARDVALRLDAAPRAVALARAAVLLSERSGLKREAARALDGLGRAQVATGDRAAARATFERSRSLATAQGDPLGAARSLEAAAQAFLDTGDAEAAVDRLELAQDGHAAAGARAAAARDGLRAGEIRFGRGDLVAAGTTLEKALVHAAAAGDDRLAAEARILLARVRLAEGQLGSALAEAEAVATDRARSGERAAEALARTVRAQGLLAAGAPDEARAELRLARDHLEGIAAARALEARAELRLADASPEGHDEGHELLAAAGELHGATRPVEAVRTRVRRGEAALALARSTTGPAAEAARTAASVHLAQVVTCEAPELVGRIALLEAGLAADDGTRRAALDRAFDLAFATDHALPRIAAGLARGSARLDAGKPALAAADLRAALETVRDVRKSLPEARHAAYMSLPLVRETLAKGTLARSALAASRSEKRPEDETAGIETTQNALDVLLGGLGPAPV